MTLSVSSGVGGWLRTIGRCGIAALGLIAGSWAATAAAVATHTVPLRLPGPPGLKPALSLTYDSQRGDGLLGPGWALSGLSSISRCNRTVAQDGFAAAVTLTFNDAFCLDGQPLRIINAAPANYGQPGTAYAVSDPTFSQITAIGTAGNGPASFTVESTSGLTYEFGATTDSRTVPDATIGTVHTWALSKVSDRFGGSYVLTHGTANSGSIRVPLTLSYAPTSPGADTYTHRITFTYGGRAAATSTMSAYVAGFHFTNARLLRSISVSINGTLSSRFSLTYDIGPVTGRGRLTRIIECSDTTGTNCQPPTTVTYQNGSIQFAPDPIPVVAGSLILIATPDLDGDGRSDLVYADPTTASAYAALSTSTGPAAPMLIGSYSGFAPEVIATGDVIGSGPMDVLIPQGTEFTRFRWNGAGFSGSATGVGVTTSDSRAALLDVDADGRRDLIVAADGTGTTGRAEVRTSLNTTSAGTVTFSPPRIQTFSPPVPCRDACVFSPLTGTSPSAGIQGLDFNGDGRHDLMLSMLGQTASVPPRDAFYVLTILLSNGTGFAPGPGAPDPTPPSAPSFLSWNDDECTDIKSNGSILISGCNGRTAATVIANVQDLGYLDANVDGRSDILTRTASMLFVANSTEGQIRTIGLGIPVPAGLVSAFILDFDGDGQQDIGVATSTGISYFQRISAGMTPDLATSITGGTASN